MLNISLNESPEGKKTTRQSAFNTSQGARKNPCSLAGIEGTLSGRFFLPSGDSLSNIDPQHVPRYLEGKAPKKVKPC